MGSFLDQSSNVRVVPTERYVADCRGLLQFRSRTSPWHQRSQFARFASSCRSEMTFPGHPPILTPSLVSRTCASTPCAEFSRIRPSRGNHGRPITPAAPGGHRLGLFARRGLRETAGTGDRTAWSSLGLRGSAHRGRNRTGSGRGPHATCRCWGATPGRSG